MPLATLEGRRRRTHRRAQRPLGRAPAARPAPSHATLLSRREGSFRQVPVSGVDTPRALEVMYRGIRPSDMLPSSGRPAYRHRHAARARRRERRTRTPRRVLDAPRWALDSQRAAPPSTSRAKLGAPSSSRLHAAGRCLPAPPRTTVCKVYDDWMVHEYSAGGTVGIIPAAALPRPMDIEGIDHPKMQTAGGRDQRAGRVHCAPTRSRGKICWDRASTRCSQAIIRHPACGSACRRCPMSNVRDGRVEGLPAARRDGVVLPRLPDGT